MKLVLLLPGLKDPHATGLLRLKPWLEAAGYKTYALTYGMFLLRGFVWHLFNMPLARLVAIFTLILNELGHQVVFVAHSNGCAIAAKASEMGARFDLLVFINAATERNIRLGTNTGYLLNLRVPTDPVLNVSRLIAPVSPWAGLDGSLGNAGVKVNADPRMWDVNLTEVFGIKWSHAGAFSAENVERSGPWLVNAIRQYTQSTVEELNRTADPLL
jgi:pimeloyl-ACP methyl ester carboxylesterase